MAPDPREETGSRRQLPPEAQIKLRFEKFSSFVEEYSSSISLGGMFVKTHRPRPVNAEIVFEFKLVDGFRLIHGQGDVVWVRPKDSGADRPAGMGVRFKALDESGRQLVLKLLEEQVKSGGAPFDVDEIPADAHDQPVAGEQMSLIDISEDQTLVGTTATESSEREELGFDAPWGDKLPEIPTELLDGGGAEAAAVASSTAAATTAAATSASRAPATKVTASIAAAAVAAAARSEPISTESYESVASEPASPEPGPSQPASLETGPSEPASSEPAAVAAAMAANPAVAVAGTDDEDASFESEVARATESMGFQMVEATDAPAEDPVVNFDTPSDSEDSVGLEQVEPAGLEQVEPAGLEQVEPAGLEQVEPAALDPVEPVALPLAAEAAPVAEPLAFDEPAAEPMSFDQPVAEPSFDQPSFDQPSFDAPAFDAPAAEPAFDTSTAEPTFDAAVPTPAVAAEPIPPYHATDFTPLSDTASEQQDGDALPAYQPGWDPAITDEPAEAMEAPASVAVAAMPLPGAGLSGDDLSGDAGLVGDDEGAPPRTDLFADVAASSPSDTAEPELGVLGIPTQPAVAGEIPPLDGSASLADATAEWEEPVAEESGLEETGLEGTGWEGTGYGPPPKPPSNRKHLIAVGLLALLVVGALLFKDTLAPMIGLGGGDENIAALGMPAEQDRPQARRQPVQQTDLATSEPELDSDTDLDAGFDEGAFGGDDVSLPPPSAPPPSAPPSSEGPSSAPPSSEPARQQAAASPARATPPPTSAPAARPARTTPPPPPRGAAASRIEDISWSNGAGETRVTIRFDGSIADRQYEHDPLSWATDREMVQLFGFANFPLPSITVGTEELRQVRVGFHGSDELRLVFDLAGGQIRSLRADGNILVVVVGRG